MLLAHYVVRVLMYEAARANDLPPRRLSFTGTLKILRCRLPECPKSRAGLQRWYENLLLEIAEEVLPPPDQPARDQTQDEQLAQKAT